MPTGEEGKQTAYIILSTEQKKNKDIKIIAMRYQEVGQQDIQSHMIWQYIFFADKMLILITWDYKYFGAILTTEWETNINHTKYDSAMLRS